MIVKNAKITSVDIIVERGFILTLRVCFDFGGSGQCLGGYVLGGIPDGKSRAQEHAKQPNLLADWVGHVLWLTERESLSEVNNCIVRVEKEDEYGPITGFGHPYLDRWLRPNDLPTHKAIAAKETPND